MLIATRYSCKQLLCHHHSTLHNAAHWSAQSAAVNGGQNTVWHAESSKAATTADVLVINTLPASQSRHGAALVKPLWQESQFAADRYEGKTLDAAAAHDASDRLQKCVAGRGRPRPICSGV